MISIILLVLAILVGGDFEKGLLNLKAVSESAAGT